MLRISSILLLTLALGVRPLSGQALRGRVVDSSGAALAGVYITLFDESGAARRVGLTDRQGRFRFDTGDAARYTLQLERSGYAPVRTGPFTSPDSLALSPSFTPAPLPSVRAGSGACAAGASYAPAAGHWAAATLALRIMALAEDRRMLDVRGGHYVRMLDARTKAQQGVIEQAPFAATSIPYPGGQQADAGFRGFTGRDSAGALAYRIPVPDLLLAPGFLQTHCVHRIVSERSRAAQIGLGFQPVKGTAVAGIEGTLWLDAASGKPRTIEYQYRDPAKSLPEGTHGLVAFGIGRDGLPQVVRWWVRVPSAFQTSYSAGGGASRSTSIVESGAFTLGVDERPIDDADGVFASLGSVFRLDPIEVQAAQAQREQTEQFTKVIAQERVQAYYGGSAWDVVQNLGGSWLRRGQALTFNAQGLALQVYLDRMPLTCKGAVPSGGRPQSIYGQLPPPGGAACMSPEAALASVPAEDIASIEYYPPVEAGIVFGMSAGFGAIVIHTRRR